VSTPDDRPPDDRPAIAIVGPTAVGKTAAALAVCLAEGGEVVSLDSRLLYRGMDIGTAKPSAAERAAVPHHLVDVAEPSDVLSLAEVKGLADAAAADIARRGRRVVFVGGTGQYVRAVLEGWAVPAVAPDEALRAALFALADAEGAAAVHARLAAVDALAAARLHPHNVRRVIRAIEVWQATGHSIVALQARREGGHAAIVIGLDRAAADLEARIDARIDAMLAAGLEAEVRALVTRGLTFGHPNMSGVGYAEWRAAVEGGETTADVALRLRATTRRLVRKQRLWFRRTDARITWLDLAPGDDGGARAVAAVRGGRATWGGGVG